MSLIVWSQCKNIFCHSFHNNVVFLVVVPRSDMGDLQRGVVTVRTRVATETTSLTLPHSAPLHILLVSLHGGVRSWVEKLIDVKGDFMGICVNLSKSI